LPAGINDASVASITELAQVSAGDGITLISSQTASQLLLHYPLLLE
jgi:hypothetical protein